jgi:hypothetical protein
VCHERGLSALLTAHHWDDQAELLLIRLTRASGLTGLAGMAASSFPHMAGRPLHLVRPLLGAKKVQLKQVRKQAFRGACRNDSGMEKLMMGKIEHLSLFIWNGINHPQRAVCGAVLVSDESASMGHLIIAELSVWIAYVLPVLELQLWCALGIRKL